MQRRDYTDIVTGAVLALFGAFIVVYALNSMQLGTLNQMGPGYFPVMVGTALAGFGIAIMVPAFFRGGTVEPVEWRSAITVLASVAAFALLVRPLGLVPAICAQLLVASLAEPVFRPVPLIVMAITLPAAAWLIFDVALGLTLVMFRMPF